MGLFSRKKSFSETVITPTFIPVSLVNSILTSGTATDKKLLELYLSVPELQAILNYRALAFADMHVKAQDKEGNEKEIPQLGLFAKPNPLQGFKEFAIQYHVLKDIFGNGFIHPVFFKPENAEVMWNLPPVNAEVIPVDNAIIPFNTTDLSEIVKEYQFQYDGKTLHYPPEEIIHYNDNQVQFDDDKFLLGSSKLTPLVQACMNIKAAYESRGVLIENSALGILSNATSDSVTGTAPLDNKDKQDLQNDYAKYGLTKAKWQLILTNMSLNWQSMAVDKSKLKLFEEVDADFRTIANAYSFPPEILQTDSTYENKEKAIKQLYTGSIKPEADGWLQGFSNFMGLENITFVSDFSHVPELQADLEKRSKAMNWASMSLAKAIESGFLTSEDATEEFKKYLL